VKLFPNFTRHHLITHTNFISIVFVEVFETGASLPRVRLPQGKSQNALCLPPESLAVFFTVPQVRQLPGKLAKTNCKSFFFWQYFGRFRQNDGTGTNEKDVG